MMTGYSLEGLVLNQWAPLEHFADGRWRRVWRIVLANALPPDIDWEGVSKEAQGAGFNVSFDEKGTREIDATVVTTEHGWSAPYYFVTYRMFELIDKRVGRISAIQGQERELWRPFRERSPDDK